MSGDKRDNDIESDADKRAYYTALERKRRNNVKDSFMMLREKLPFSEGKRASRAQMLKTAVDYITTMRRNNTVYQHYIDVLKRQNQALDEQFSRLEEARTPENLASANLAVERAKMTLENINIFRGKEYGDTSESEAVSESDSSDNSRDFNDNPRKRLKTTTDPSRM